MLDLFLPGSWVFSAVVYKGEFNTKVAFTRNNFTPCVNLCYNVAMKKTLFTILALSSLLLLSCNHFTEIELIVVSKTPRGAYADEDLPPELHNIGWHDIGLSRNGQEPIEYIWCLRHDNPLNYTIINAEIGDKGIVYLHVLAKMDKIKLPRPNPENPLVIGLFWEVYWEKMETNLHQESGDVNDKQWDVMLGDKKYIILRPHILRDIETGEVIDLRDVDRRIFGD